MDINKKVSSQTFCAKDIIIFGMAFLKELQQVFNTKKVTQQTHRSSMAAGQFGFQSHPPVITTH